MQWRTEVEIPEGKPKIHYTDHVLTLGSCFAGHLTEKFRYYQFPHLGNPFGVVFHPAPMERLVRRAAEALPFTEEDVFQHQGRWRSLEVHSSLSGATREEALQAINGALDTLRLALGSVTHAVVTLGTAYGFTHLRSGQTVANCHKLPAAEFRKELSPVDAIVESVGGLLQLLRGFRRDMTCLLTVSPVRHIRDGLVANQRSKAHLITAAHALVTAGHAHYFPAYELFMDELRDYRFYGPDMIHPTGQAVDFVWERFRDAWIHPGAAPLMKEVATIRTGLAHRPLHADSEAHHRWRQTLKDHTEELQAKYPQIHFDL